MSSGSELCIRVAVGIERDEGLDSPISPRFGRAPAIAVVDVCRDRVEIVSIQRNPFVDAIRGAGSGLVQILASLGVKIVAAPRVGPHALEALRALGIDLLTVSESAKLRDVIELVKRRLGA